MKEREGSGGGGGVGWASLWAGSGGPGPQRPSRLLCCAPKRARAPGASRGVRAPLSSAISQPGLRRPVPAARALRRLPPSPACRGRGPRWA